MAIPQMFGMSGGGGMQAPVVPSPAAAAGAAAAALRMQQLSHLPRGIDPDDPEVRAWSEHQTGDGRKFYHNEKTEESTWDRPECLKPPAERNNDTNWKEYKIWDGRVFWHNTDTKVSCWAVPPEIKKLRGQDTLDDEIEDVGAMTNAERRRAFWHMLEEIGVDSTWTFRRLKAALEARAGDPRGDYLTESQQKQVLAEWLSLCMRKSAVESREKQRNARSALEKLFEEQFSGGDLAVRYQDAKALLQGQEAFDLVESDIKREEIFQATMERLEEKERQTAEEARSDRIVKLQRAYANHPELRRPRARWMDAQALLADQDEFKDTVPLEALRVWQTFKELPMIPERPVTNTYRDQRKQRDAFADMLRELAQVGKITGNSTWMTVRDTVENDPRYLALYDNPGSVPAELFDDFLFELRLSSETGDLSAVPIAVDEDLPEWPMAKRRRKEAEDATQDAPAVNPFEEADKAGAEKEADEEEDKAYDAFADDAPAAPKDGTAETPADDSGAPKAASATPKETFKTAQLAAKKMDELRELCRERDLAISGRKAELITRLAAWKPS